MSTPSPINRQSSANAAFSLIEIMVTVALLSMIILGLVMMFSQTQRAFKTSLTQVDVLEGGRAVSEMLAREVSEMTPSLQPLTTNCMILIQANSRQGMPSTNVNNPILRTNSLDHFFFMTKVNMDWTGIGYTVIQDTPDCGVGALYRNYATARGYWVPALSSNFLWAVATGAAATNSRIVDGVVHFKVVPFAKNGFPLVHDPGYTNAFYRTNLYGRPFYGAVANADSYASPYFTDQYGYHFFSNAVPAYVELELGLWESQTLERYRSIAADNPNARLRFFSNHVAQVHLFRQRIPIRNFDPSAYP